MNYLIVMLQDGPAQTTNFMIAGYAVIFGVMGLYLLSLWLRQRNMSQDLALFEELEDTKE